MSKTSLLCVMVLCAVSVQADTLRLRNGTTIEGKFVSGTEKGIWFVSKVSTDPLLYATFHSNGLVRTTFTDPASIKEVRLRGLRA